jgi:glycogen synthase
LLRSAVDIGIFPSIFEPCGLVQGEMHRMGVETAATATGGFVDTIFTSGPNQNGYLFAKFPDWESEEQDNAIRATVKEATEKAQARLHALYQGNAAARQESVEQKRTIMQNAANSTWEKTFDGSLSPIEKLTRAYGKSMRFRNKRGIIFTDLQGLRMETYS